MYSHKVKFFEECIKEKDFKSLAQFISTYCETEKDLIEICKKSYNVTLDMIGELVLSITEYMNNSDKAMISAKRLRDSGILSNETKEKLNNYIKNERYSNLVMGCRLQYFIEVIEKGILNQGN